MLYHVFIILWFFGVFPMMVDSELIVNDTQEITNDGEFQVLQMEDFTIPNMLNHAFAALNSKGPLDFLFNLEMILPDRTLRNYTRDMGLLSLMEEYHTTGIELIYRFQFFSPDTSVHMPLKLKIHRGQSIYLLIHSVCPNYHQHKLCSHIAYHVNEAYYGVNFAPSRNTSNEDDFTMSRSVLIHYLAQRYSYRTYLEIGCEYNKNFNLFYNGSTFDVVVGVDPLLGGTLRMTSDDYFHQNNMLEKEHRSTFDVIFIDGLHEAHQLYLDVENALQILNVGGTIILHDCHPAHPNYASFPRDEEDANYYWNGDAYRAAIALRLRNDIEIIVIDADHGLGVIRRRQNLHPLSPALQDELRGSVTGDPIDPITWTMFMKDKEELMRLMTVSQFHTWLDEEEVVEDINQRIDDDNL